VVEDSARGYVLWILWAYGDTWLTWAVAIPLFCGSDEDIFKFFGKVIGGGASFL